MKFATTNIGQQLMRELRSLPDYPFERRCLDIIQTAYPLAQPTPARSEFDFSGIDHCLWLAESNGIDTVWQCKGFSAPEFSHTQLSQCLKSIETFSAKGLKANRYFLIVNRIVKGKDRQQIESALETLKQTNGVTEALLLDPEAFLEEISIACQRQVEAMLRQSLSVYQQKHQSRMNEDIYLPGVIFRVQSETANRHDPITYSQRNILDLAFAKTNKRIWTFVSGEFGFGKTSLTLRLAQSLQDEGMICVYFPIAEFRPLALEMESEFLWQALELASGEEINRERLKDKIFHAALKETVKREKNILLILDGLDEHPICWRESGLKNIFGIFKTFNVCCLFTLREEFLAERTGYFETAIKVSPGTVMYKLQEWDDPLILKFVELHEERVQSSEARTNIEHFKSAIQTGRYVNFYGDIPKRPLFLKMLMSDVAKEDIRSRNLAEIYQNYLLNKFYTDRETSSDNPTVRRPLSMADDFTVVMAKLFGVMEYAAGTMWQALEGAIVLERNIPESELLECIQKVNGTSIDIPTVISNSVLVPVGRRNFARNSGSLTFAFAHKSFQTYFLARFIVNGLQQKSFPIDFFHNDLPPSLCKFLDNLLQLLSPDERNDVLRYTQSNDCDLIAKLTALA